MFRVRTLGGIHLSEIMEYLAEGYAFYPLILNIAKQINNYPLIFCCTWFLNMKRPFFSLKRQTTFITLPTSIARINCIIFQISRFTISF